MKTPKTVTETLSIIEYLPSELLQGILSYIRYNERLIVSLYSKRLRTTVLENLKELYLSNNSPNPLSIDNIKFHNIISLTLKGDIRSLDILKFSNISSLWVDCSYGNFSLLLINISKLTNLKNLYIFSFVDKKALTKQLISSIIIQQTIEEIATCTKLENLALTDYIYVASEKSSVINLPNSVNYHCLSKLTNLRSLHFNYDFNANTINKIVDAPLKLITSLQSLEGEIMFRNKALEFLSNLTRLKQLYTDDTYVEEDPNGDNLKLFSCLSVKLRYLDLSIYSDSRLLTSSLTKLTDLTSLTLRESFHPLRDMYLSGIQVLKLININGNDINKLIVSLPYLCSLKKFKLDCSIRDENITLNMEPESNPDVSKDESEEESVIMPNKVLEAISTHCSQLKEFSILGYNSCDITGLQYLLNLKYLKRLTIPDNIVDNETAKNLFNNKGITLRFYF